MEKYANLYMFKISRKLNGRQTILNSVLKDSIELLELKLIHLPKQVE